MSTKLERLLVKSCEQDCEKAFVHMLDDMKRQFPPLSYGKRRVLKLTISIFISIVILSFLNIVQSPTSKISGILRSTSDNPLIVIITPTYKRTTRLADLTRMANTLMHIKDLHWVIVEDGEMTYPYIKEMLDRTKIPFTYMAHRTKIGYPRKGWWQRNMALTYVRDNLNELLNDREEGILYFGDDDNSYDIRLFDDYIRKVKKVGMWAVGLVGGVPVETPKVVDGKVIGFNVRWNPNRVFAIDMAGFAINLKIVMNTTTVFNTECKRGLGAPETCLLEDMGLTRSDIEPFGFEKAFNKDILVWHTKTKTPEYDRRKADNFGYVFEFGRNNTIGVPVKKKHSKV